MSDKEKSARDEAETRKPNKSPDQDYIPQRDPVSDEQSAHRGMDDDDRPHDVSERTDDYVRSQVTNKDQDNPDATADADDYFGDPSNDFDEDVDRKRRAYQGKDHTADPKEEQDQQMDKLKRTAKRD